MKELKSHHGVYPRSGLVLSKNNNIKWKKRELFTLKRGVDGWEKRRLKSTHSAAAILIEESRTLLVLLRYNEYGIWLVKTCLLLLTKPPNTPWAAPATPSHQSQLYNTIKLWFLHDFEWCEFYLIQKVYFRIKFDVRLMWRKKKILDTKNL